MAGLLRRAQGAQYIYCSDMASTPADALTMRAAALLPSALCAASVLSIAIPSTPPSSAAAIDPSLLSVSIEFFAFPGYTQLAATSNCLANLAGLRGAQPAIRIGGTTQ